MSIDASNAEFESINVSDDISGFRNITADKLKVLVHHPDHHGLLAEI